MFLCVGLGIGAFDDLENQIRRTLVERVLRDAGDGRGNGDLLEVRALVEHKLRQLGQVLALGDDDCLQTGCAERERLDALERCGKLDSLEAHAVEERVGAEVLEVRGQLDAREIFVARERIVLNIGNGVGNSDSLDAVVVKHAVADGGDRVVLVGVGNHNVGQ